MAQNQYDKFYSAQTVEELIEMLRSHHRTGQTLDKEWYERLKAHLADRNLSADQTAAIREILATEPAIPQNFKAEKTEKSKYPTLQALSSMLFFLAWVVFLATIVVVIVQLNNLDDGGTWSAAILALLIGSIVFTVLYAGSEIINILLDIEQNTRKTDKTKTEI